MTIACLLNNLLMNTCSNVFTTVFERQHCITMYNGNITNRIRTKQIIMAWKQKQCNVRLLPTRCKLARYLCNVRHNDYGKLRE